MGERKLCENRTAIAFNVDDETFCLFKLNFRGLGRPERMPNTNPPSSTSTAGLNSPTALHQHRIYLNSSACPSVLEM